MLRIEIHWTFVSPFLQVVSGTLFVHRADKNKFTRLAKYEVKKERGTLSLNSIEYHDDFTTEIYDKIYHTIETMIESYYRGMLMNKRDFHWVDENGETINRIGVTFNTKRKE